MEIPRRRNITYEISTALPRTDRNDRVALPLRAWGRYPEPPITRILLVEDDVDLRLIMEHVLIDGGHQVDTTSTVEGGCELLGCRFYDLVIADGRLSDGTGMEVADRAREKRIKTLIVTG